MVDDPIRRGLGHAKTFFELLRKRIANLVEKELREAANLLNKAYQEGQVQGNIPYPPSILKCDQTLVNRCPLCFGGVFENNHRYGFSRSSLP